MDRKLAPCGCKGCCRTDDECWNDATQEDLLCDTCRVAVHCHVFGTVNHSWPEPPSELPASTGLWQDMKSEFLPFDYSELRTDDSLRYTMRYIKETYHNIISFDPGNNVTGVSYIEKMYGINRSDIPRAE